MTHDDEYRQHINHVVCCANLSFPLFSAMLKQYPSPVERLFERGYTPCNVGVSPSGKVFFVAWYRFRLPR